MTRRKDDIAPREALREEAAAWFALMRGPEAALRRAEFEAWMQRGAAEREAYNRIAETFTLGKSLRYADLSPMAARAAAGSIEAERRWPRAGIMAATAVLVAGALTFAWLGRGALAGLAEGPGAGAPIADARLHLATGVGEIRRFALPDGSAATLDTNSLAEVRFGSESRDIRLVKGRARFFVAHDRRPFVVAAGAGSVTAVGTVFDVALGEEGRIDVRLLRGAVDVATPSRKGWAIRRLAAGQVLTLTKAAPLRIGGLGKAADADWPEGQRDYDAVRLAEVLADANRYGAVRLSAAEGAVADMRISGTFRIDEPRTVAANLAEVLGLARIERPGEIVLVRRCPAKREENCTPPS